DQEQCPTRTDPDRQADAETDIQGLGTGTAAAVTLGESARDDRAARRAERALDPLIDEHGIVIAAAVSIHIHAGLTTGTEGQARAPAPAKIQSERGLAAGPIAGRRRDPMRHVRAR